MQFRNGDQLHSRRPFGSDGKARSNLSELVDRCGPCGNSIEWVTSCKYIGQDGGLRASSIAQKLSFIEHVIQVVCP